MKFDLERALSHTIVLIAGDEDVLRRRALHELVDAAAGGDDFDLEAFWGDGSRPGEWIGSCGTAPFLSPRRVAIVRNLLRCDLPEELGKPQLPETALLVLVADSEAGDDAKQKTLAARLKRWEKAVTDAKGFLYRPSVSSTAFSEIMVKEAAAQGYKLTPRAVSTLREMVGGNLSVGLDELEKVFLYADKRSQITEADIEQVVFPSREWSVFRLIDAVFGGQGGEALRQLRTMVGSNPRPESAALGQILPMLNRQLRLVWQARIFQDARASLTSPPESVKAQLPSTHSLLAQKEYSQNVAMRHAQSVNHRQLAACFRLISHTEAQIKGQLPSYSATEALEQMVLTMTEAVRR